MTAPLSPLRCVVVTPYGALGGSERWLLGLLDAAGARLDVEVWMLQDGPLRQELETRGVSVRVLATGAGARDVVARTRDLLRRLRATDADVVMANGVKAAAATVPAARLAGVPVAWVKHDFSFDRTLAPVLGRLSDLVVATSAAVAEATRRDDAVVVPPPRPTALPASTGEAQRFWTDRGVVTSTAGAPVMAMLCRLVSYKGVDTAIRALALDTAATWTLVVVGPHDPSEPAEPHRLRALADELGVGPRLCLAGEIEDAGRHLATFDAVGVLTRDTGDGFGREGYSMVALEALTCGVPLVGAAGNPEVERMASVAGRVVPADAPAAVAAALADLGDPTTGAWCAQAGRELMAEHPDAAECADRVVGALATLGRRPGAGLLGPPVSVLTCMRNESGHVDGVVGAVLAQLGPDDEYLLLDDQSTDSTPDDLAAWAARDHRIRLLDGPGVNLSAARNHGFSEARHDVVVCTDAGCEPSSTWLSALRAPYAESAPVDLVVGVYEVDGGSPLREASRLALFPSIAEARRRTPVVRLAGLLAGRRFDPRRLDGRSMACAVTSWKEAGGFDESLGSSEDAVFGEAVLSSGGTSALALDAGVTWEQSGTLVEMAQMYVKYGEWGGALRLLGPDQSRPRARRGLPRGAGRPAARARSGARRRGRGCGCLPRRPLLPRSRRAGRAGRCRADARGGGSQGRRQGVGLPARRGDEQLAQATR